MKDESPPPSALAMRFAESNADGQAPSATPSATSAEFFAAAAQTRRQSLYAITLGFVVALASLAVDKNSKPSYPVRVVAIGSFIVAFLRMNRSNEYRLEAEKLAKLEADAPTPGGPADEPV